MVSTSILLGNYYLNTFSPWTHLRVCISEKIKNRKKLHTVKLNTQFNLKVTWVHFSRVQQNFVDVFVGIQPNIVPPATSMHTL